MNIFLISFFLAICPLLSQDLDKKIGDENSGSRSIPVHNIKLFDADSSIIWLDEVPLMPFSTKYSCGVCHNYAKISEGLHFNAGISKGDGRVGQPWIFSDPYSATIIPLSFRSWQATYNPEEIGLDNFEFFARFGRQMPGGGMAENENSFTQEKYWRWQVSGKLEINCLICHDVEKSNDRAEYAEQILKENFRWATTAGAGFAEVEGSARNLADTYDIYAGVNNITQDEPPKVSYQQFRFNKKSEVFFDISKKIPNENCYFCHSTKTIKTDNTENWHFDEDVHLKAGMLCIDCHSHGLDHKMTRGDILEAQNPNEISLTCQGCHLGLQEINQPTPLSGRFGAPRPEHAGLPTIHFEKLSCTTCHSGNWPTENTERVKTSMGHGLGLHSANKNNASLPHIFTPVFSEKEGVIYPENLIWPAFWAYESENSIKPFREEVFIPVARKIIGHIDSLEQNSWPRLNDSTLLLILDSLSRLIPSDQKTLYVSGGKIHFKNAKGKLDSKKHNIAQPYSWPIAHDVRPATQSLGINGCNDCHDAAAPFYFSKMGIDSPIPEFKNASYEMVSFQSTHKSEVLLFSYSFLFRPFLKYLMLGSCILLLAVLIIYGFKGLTTLMEFFSADEIYTEDRK